MIEIFWHNNKKPVCMLLFFCFFIFLVINFFGLIGGVLGSSLGPPNCLAKPRNIELLVPGYRFGCWLRGYQGEPYYYEEFKND